MPRKVRGSRQATSSTSSEQSVNSDQNENANTSAQSNNNKSSITLEDLPDPGLVKGNGSGTMSYVKEKKRVTFNFPLSTKDGRYVGTGTINLMEAPESSDELGNVNGSIGKEIVYDLTKDKGVIVQTIQETILAPTKTKGAAKKRVLPKENQPKPPEPVKSQDSEKQDTVKKAAGQKPMVRVEPIKPNLGAKKKNQAEAPKTAAEAQKEAQRQQAALEKQEVEDFEEYHKIYKPGECLKYMNIEIHPELACQDFMEDLKKEAGQIGVSIIEAEDICDPGIILFTRTVPPRLASEQGQKWSIGLGHSGDDAIYHASVTEDMIVKLSDTKKQSARAIYVITADEMLTLVETGCVMSHIAHKHELVGGKLTVAVFGTAKFFNHLPHGDEASRSKRSEFGKAMADLQMELMVQCRLDAVLVENTIDIARLIVQYARAIAEAPYKKAKRQVDEQAEFFMKGDNKNCVAVDKDGNGLSRLWEQMIAVLPKSSLEVARSLGGKYTTPRALTKELQSLGGIEKIADIEVQRSTVPGAKPRRLGPEFSRKLYTLFTAEDGDMVIE